MVEYEAIVEFRMDYGERRLIGMSTTEAQGVLDKVSSRRNRFVSGVNGFGPWCIDLDCLHYARLVSHEELRTMVAQVPLEKRSQELPTNAVFPPGRCV